jgi:hypothetical protein
LKFQELVYKISGHNPHYDETLFVSQYLKGLKNEIRLPVASQIPESLDRAILLAHVQQDLQAKSKPWAHKSLSHSKAEQPTQRQESAEAAVKLGGGSLWKDRQLREWRRANGECYHCGEKYSPTHKCAQRAEINALTTELDTPVHIAEEVLELLELQDIANSQELSLSLNAIAGSQGDGTIRIRALVDNQVMLLLVDSGSSNTFVSDKFVQRLHCETVSIPAVSVKVASGDVLQCDRMVPQLSWWAQGHTFETDMRVLPLGAYDAILGVDWLKQCGEMRCSWVTKTLKFEHRGKEITLHGIPTKEQGPLQEVPVEQLWKWSAGNDVWAVAVLTQDMVFAAAEGVPAEIQAVLKRYEPVFAESSELPPHREYDHAIALQPNAVPVNARPYRYSPLHKDQIERQIRNMLKAGIIVPSMSPFASPG